MKLDSWIFFKIESVRLFFCVVLLCTWIVYPVSTDKGLKNAKDSVENFKLRLHRALEGVRIRRTRSLDEHNKNIFYKVSSFNSSKNHSESSVVSWITVHSEDKTRVFAALNNGKIVLFEDFSFLSLFSSAGALYNLEGFSSDFRLWLVGLQIKGDRHLVQVYEYQKQNGELIKSQLFYLLGQSFISIQNIKGRVYLSAVSNDRTYSLLQIFVWTGTQFDGVLSLPLRGICKAFVSWIADHSLVLAVSFRNNKVAILSYVELFEKLDPVELLNYNCHILKHFDVAGSHYLACGSHNKTTVLWWSGVQFLKLQEIASSNEDTITDIDTVVLEPDNAVLVIAKANRLEYYLQDQVGDFINTGGYTQIPGTSKLKDISVWSHRNQFYLLPVYQSPETPTVIEVDIYFDHEDESVDDGLKSCTAKLLEHINNTNLLLTKDTDHVWTRDNPHYLAFVTVNGGIISNHSLHASQVSIVADVDSSLNSTLHYLKDLKSRVRRAVRDLSNSVLKMGPQNIGGNVYFSGDIKSSSADIYSLNFLPRVNDVDLTVVLNTALKKSGYQTFFRQASFVSGHIETIMSGEFNNRSLDDYVLLRNDQTVHGWLCFERISADNVNVYKTVNALLPDKLVRSTIPQEIRDTKQFSTLSTKILDVTDPFSNINVKLFTSILTKPSPSFENTLVGNLNVKYVNGKNLRKLLTRSVTKNGNQTINGLKTFKYLRIHNELSLSGTLNNQDLSQLMTLHTPQTIFGDIYIPLIQFNSVLTGLINGIDLTSDAVLNGPLVNYIDLRSDGMSDGEYIRGRVTFLEPVVVKKNVNVKDGVTLNGRDLSEEDFAGEVVFLEGVVLVNVAAANVEIRNVAFGNVLGRLERDVWRKKKNQVIPYSKFRLMIVPELSVSRMNSIDIDDFVLLSANSFIDSFKEFNAVTTDSLKVTNEKKTNVLGFSIDRYLDLLSSSKKVIVQGLTVKGNLNVTKLWCGISGNRADVSNALTLKSSQTMNGTLEFHVAYLRELKANHVNLSSSFGNNFAAFLERAVTLPIRDKILSKRFAKIITNNLEIDGYLNSDEEKYEGYRDSLVTLNGAQDIFGDLNFNGKSKVRSLPRPTSSNNRNFTRGISTINVQCNFINGINVDHLFKNAALKGRNNIFHEPVTFKSDLIAKKVETSEDSSINGIILRNLIKTNSNFVGSSFNFAEIVVPNLHIRGTLNDCDLSKLSSLPSRTVTNTRNLPYLLNSVKELQSLKIFGNLYIYGKINGIDANVFLKLSYKPKTSSIVNEKVFTSNLDVINLNIRNSVNGLSIPFILQDAVLSNVRNQVIRGKKKFSNMSSDATSILNLSLPSEQFVSKSGSQNLLTRKLHDVTARTVIVKGRVNTLKLPSDVVLTYTNDRLYSTVSTNDTTTVESDLFVRGKLNGERLYDFLANRVKLTENEELFSRLTFLNDVKISGTTFLWKGTINNILLKEVVQTEGNHSLSGNKTFEDELETYKIEVLGSVNDVVVEDIYENYIDQKKGDIFNIHTVEFDNNIRCPKLTIQGNINNMTSKVFNVIFYTQEDFISQLIPFSDDLNGVNKKAQNYTQYLDNAPDLSRQFKYFEWHQTLNIGATIRLIAVHGSDSVGESSKPQTQEAIAWILKNETYCSYYNSMRLQVFSNGTLEPNRNVFGRLFNFSLSSIKEDVKGFSILTDRNKRCLGDRQSPQLDLWSTLYINDEEYQNWALRPAPDATILDAKLIEFADSIFILVAYLYSGNGNRIFLYRYDLIDHAWSQQQEFYQWNPTSIALMLDITQDSDTFLSVTGGIDYPSVNVYRWEPQIDGFEWQSRAMKSSSTDSIWIDLNLQYYLLLAKEKIQMQEGYGSVDSYTEPTEVMTVLQGDVAVDRVIGVYGVNRMEKFSIGDDIFILAVSSYFETISVIQYRGYNGFEVIQKMAAPGVIDVTVFWTSNDALMLAVTSKNGLQVMRCIIRVG